MGAKKKLRRQWDQLGREEVRGLQSAMLQRFVRDHVYPFSSYYRKVFKERGIDADTIRGIDDLQRLPFTSKLDLVSTPEEPKKSRSFVLIPDAKVLAKRPSVIARSVLLGKQRVKEALAYEYRPVFLTSTTGRSAEPVPFLYTRHDVDHLASAGKRLVEVLGARQDERLINMFPFAPHLAFWQTYYATLTFGAFSVSTGGGKVMGTDGNIRMMQSVQPEGLIGMPTFLYHVLHQAVEEGRRCETLRTLVLGGEKVPKGMRKKLVLLAQKLGANEVSVVGTYGFTECRTAWGECPHPIDGPTSGYHLYPDLGIIEIIDPETGDVLPDGHPGEIVYTPIDARGSVVLRYRTGDFIDGGLVHEPCPHCRRMMPRLVGNISRSSQVTELRLDKIKGTLVDFNELEHILDDAEHVGAWQLELRKLNDDPMELDELILHVEKLDSSDDAAVLERELCERFAAHTELRPNSIQFHSSAAMRERQGVGKEIKEKRVVDNRPVEEESG